MKIKELVRRENLEADKKIMSHYNFLENLFEELEHKGLPSEIISLINQNIELLNSFSESDKDLLKLIQKIQVEILQLLEKELKYVCKGHYRTLWLSVGMAAFGLPIGVLFGFSLDSMAFIGLGLPIGILIGMTYGISLDKKAQEEGRQIETEFNF